MALENLKPSQLKAAALLAAGTSCKNTAKQCEVTPETISHWKRNSDFVAHLNQLKKDAVECARERLRNLNADAVGVLEGLLESSSDSIRLQAARYILDAMLVDPKRAKEGIGSTDPTLVRMSLLDFT
jgi:hypothetical protein